MSASVLSSILTNSETLQYEIIAEEPSIFDKSKTMKILEIFLISPYDFFSVKDICERTNISKPTVSQKLKQLYDNGFVKIRKVGNANTYSLARNDVTKSFYNFLMNLLDYKANTSSRDKC